jgi:hypothetical protein
MAAHLLRVDASTVTGGEQQFVLGFLALSFALVLAHVLFSDSDSGFILAGCVSVWISFNFLMDTCV